MLNDAKKIYDEIDRLDYVEHWQEKCKKLEEKINKLGLTATRDAVKDFDKYFEIMTSMSRLTGVLADLNTLNPQLLSADNFEKIIQSLLASITDKPALP